MTRSDLPDSILHAAAAWRARHDAGLSAAEEREFFRWLESDARHAHAFAEFDATWKELDRARDLSPAQLGIPAGSRAADRPGPSASRRPARVRLAVGVAACLALAAGAALWNASPRAAPAAPATIVATDFRRLDLPDGSVARLKAGAAVAVEFSDRERRLRLVRGEAHFTVIRDPQRPFAVLAAGVDVRAVGTAFGVSHRERAVEVIVTEGRVRLAGATGGELPELGAGDKVVVPFADRAIPDRTRLSEAELADALAWQRQVLAFDAAPLSEIVAEFNRFNSHRLEIDDPGLSERRFGGSFRADDPEGFVALLAATAGIVPTRLGDTTRLRRAR